MSRRVLEYRWPTIVCVYSCEFLEQTSVPQGWFVCHATPRFLVMVCFKTNNRHRALRVGSCVTRHRDSLLWFVSKQTTDIQPSGLVRVSHHIASPCYVCFQNNRHIASPTSGEGCRGQAKFDASWDWMKHAFQWLSGAPCTDAQEADVDAAVCASDLARANHCVCVKSWARRLFLWVGSCVTPHRNSLFSVVSKQQQPHRLADLGIRIMIRM